MSESEPDSEPGSEFGCAAFLATTAQEEGQHQVTKDAARVERSVAVTLMAYLVLLRVCATDIRPG